MPNSDMVSALERAYSSINFAACSLNKPPSEAPRAAPSGPATMLPTPVATRRIAIFRIFPEDGADIVSILVGGGMNHGEKCPQERERGTLRACAIKQQPI